MFPIRRFCYFSSRTLPARARLGALVFLLACGASVHAEIYKHVDAEGRITFSNIPMKGAVRLDLNRVPVSIPSNAPGRGPTARASSTPTPADFPKVDKATQGKRDVLRRQIWQDELGNEEKLLTEARARLAKAEPDKAARLREDVLMHEKNIEALKKEMARVN